MNDVLFQTESEIIESLAEKEDCVIIGRFANHILKDKCRSVFIHAPFEYRVKTVMNRLDRTEKSARAMIRKIDKERRSYYEYFTDERWLDMSQYDLCIDKDRFHTAPDRADAESHVRRNELNLIYTGAVAFDMSQNIDTLSANSSSTSLRS